MKLVTFSVQGEMKAGVLEDDRVIDVHESYKSYLKSKESPRIEEKACTFVPNNIKEIIEGGEESLQHVKNAVSFAREAGDTVQKKLTYARTDVRLEAPLRDPQKILCVGHNYREHILEMGRDLPKYPVAFAKFANTIIGPEDDIPKYPISDQLDYEAEFAVVIGKQAKNVEAKDALSYVGGYTIANDVTYRDLQRRTLQWLQGKSLDGTAPIGPWLVTKDELPDPASLEIDLSVNGEERQRSNTKNLVFRVEHLVEFFSGLMTLEPGDIILTGTPGGVGVARDPQTFLQDGDTVTINVSGIGTLENTVRNV